MRRSNGARIHERGALAPDPPSVAGRPRPAGARRRSLSVTTPCFLSRLFRVPCG